MASTQTLVLYPPIVNSYSPAFEKDCEYKRIYFSYPSFLKYEEDGTGDFNSVHITIDRQESGITVLKESIGMLIDLIPHKEDDKLYVNIPTSQIKDGWQEGWLYKIQLRLSAVKYSDAVDISKMVWLNQNSNLFSEWSTICVTKAITEPTIMINNLLPYDTTGHINILDSINFYGTYSYNQLSNEPLYRYKIITELEESSWIYASSSDNFIQYLRYDFNSDYIIGKQYTINFIYETINKYQNSISYHFNLKNNSSSYDIVPLTFEENSDIMKKYTNISEEEDSGRIGIKLYSKSGIAYKGRILIRRTDSNSNFTKWDDFKIIDIGEVQKPINDLPIFYDYTIESGVYYKYGAAILKEDDTRCILNKMEKYSMRIFEYSFLLGENEQQLKLKFNNTMNSFKYVVSESKIDTIGGKYALYSKNGQMFYRNFPLNCLISIDMNDDNLFINNNLLYNSEEINNIFNNDLLNRPYDKQMIKEKMFRDKVLNFFYNDNFKLFKSPTEGNIIIKIMDINLTPNQSLNRVIYELSANAYESEEANMENYIKNNFNNYLI